MTRFETIDYLQHGNERQRAAFQVLVKYNVMGKLAAFDPLLAGTIPIGVDVAQSDLDVICCWSDKAKLREALLRYFSGCACFRLHDTEIKGQESMVATFRLDGFEVEVFGQGIPSREQDAFRHLLVEYRLLQKYGEPLRQQVVRLKQQGLKTEPAFTRALHLPGDPYEALLQLELGCGSSSRSLKPDPKV
ncbi:DUF4269 domain-containing protein [Pontibacter litorisediminis]|uniref:DUF4269 domain-containing protein n=1 Tax=Pontibacter litorisediminis TaxID=1846260 RepID=UPI0023EE0926|nr:DUF4269 domain-containing protein [Pontibacter litorisediminis]